MLNLQKQKIMSQLNQQKQSERFEAVIRQFLIKQGEKDPAFLKHCREVSKTQNKNTADCCTYIINQVKQSGKFGFADEEIYSMAMHYWDEDKIEVGTRPQCQIVLNHEAQLSDEEIAECKQEVRERIIRQQMEVMRPKSTPSANKKSKNEQPSLFEEL